MRVASVLAIAVTVYGLLSASTWSQSQCALQQLLIASDGADEDAFGTSLAISGPTMVCGARRDDDGGTDSGAAYVFEYEDGQWMEIQKLLSDDLGAFHAFGATCSIEGGTIIVGSPGNTVSMAFQGAAYVFVQDLTGAWNQSQRLLDPSPGAAATLGVSVDMEGDFAVVGAPGAGPGGANAGEALVFKRDQGLWSFWQRLSPSDGEPADAFGSSVAISGDIIVIGARNSEPPGGDGDGSAYVFERDGDLWTEVAPLTGSMSGIGDQFGEAVAVDDSVIVVGAPCFDGNFGNTGTAYVFEESGGVWVEIQRLPSPDFGPNDFFGRAIAVEGQTIVVGVTAGGTLPGRVDVFTPGASGLWEFHRRIAPEESEHCLFGFSIDLEEGAAAIGDPAFDPLDPIPTVGGAVITEACPCPADVDDDACVGFTDLLSVVGSWGPCLGCPADVDCDDEVSFADLLAVLNAWGDCPCTSGCGAGQTLEEVQSNAGLSQSDWDTLTDCMENGTQSEQLNCACWLEHYLADCVPSCQNLPDCPDGDPLSKH